MGRLASFRIVDFQTNKHAEKYLETIIDKYSIVVEDWMEKDYGLVIFAKVPKYNRSAVRSELGNIHGVTYDER
jgi:hypothetical protein